MGKIKKEENLGSGNRGSKLKRGERDYQKITECQDYSWAETFTQRRVVSDLTKPLRGMFPGEIKMKKKWMDFQEDLTVWKFE